MLRGVDTLVFDIQDVGARFYTYYCTMLFALEEAAKANLPFYVLDRPNPVTGVHVEGPMLDRESAKLSPAATACRCVTASRWASSPPWPMPSAN